MAIGSRVEGVAQHLLQFLVAGEVERVGGPRPRCRDVHPPHGPPDALGPRDARQGICHVTVASSRLRLQTLHAGLGVGEGERGQVGM